MNIQAAKQTVKARVFRKRILCDFAVASDSIDDIFQDEEKLPDVTYVNKSSMRVRELS